MIKEKAMELVAALRSGKYLQGTGYLKSDYDHYCCLGVACEVAGVKANLKKDDGCYYYDEHVYLLPDSVMNYFGFGSDDAGRCDGKGITINRKKYQHLPHVNDAGIPFSRIADYIEKNWKAL